MTNIIQLLGRNELLFKRKSRLVNCIDNPNWNRDAYGRKWRLIRRIQDEIENNIKTIETA